MAWEDGNASCNVPMRRVTAYRNFMAQVLALSLMVVEGRICLELFIEHQSVAYWLKVYLFVLQAMSKPLGQYVFTVFITFNRCFASTINKALL